MKAEDKQCIKHCIDDSPHQIADHGELRTAVGTNQMTAASGKNQEWETKGSNAGISSGIIKNLIGSTKKQKHRCQKKSDNDTEYNTAGNKHQKCVAHIGSGFFFSSGSHSQIKTGGTADTKHQAEGNASGGQRKGDVCCCIAKKTNALADKQLVDNVVKRADQHGNNTWNSKLAQQLSDGFVRHRVSSCCHKRFLISFKNFGAAKKSLSQQ